MNGNTNTKIRAIFLSAIVAMSVVIMGVVIPANTAAANIDDSPDYPSDKTETTVENLTITDSGHVSDRYQSLTIFEDFPKNGSGVYETSSPTENVLTPATGDHLDGFDDDKELLGQHTGIAGLPVQTDAYSNQTDHLNFQQGQQPAEFPENPRQEVLLSWDIVADEEVDEETVRIDYDDAAEAGLQVNISATNALIDANSPASDLRGWIEYDLGDGDPTGGESQSHFGSDGDNTNSIVSVDIDNAANEIAITYKNRVNASVQDLDIVLVWEPDEPVEGLTIKDGFDERIDHILRGPAGDTEEDSFRLVAAGATAVTPADRGSPNDVLGSPASEVNLSANERADGGTVGTDTTSFHIWHGQKITFIAASPDQRIRVYRAETNDAGKYVRGEKIVNQRGLPGQAITMDSSGLAAGSQYFVTFGNDSDRVAVLDVQPLDVQANAPSEVVATDDLEIEVSSSDTTGNEVEAWFLEAGDSDIGDVVHVEEATLDGTGDATLRVSPESELDAEEGGKYYARIVHPESETSVSTDTIEVVEAEDANVTIASPSSSDTFARGSIIPIELTFENTNRGTITFGDRDAHNVEINLTVRDTDGDGEGTVYLNTFQVGHGYVRTGPDTLEPNGFDPASEGSRNHGFFTLPEDDGVALEGTEGQSAVAHPDMDITGGSQGGAVLHDFAYDLSVVAGEQPYTEVNFLDDRKQVDIAVRDSGSMSLWTAPGAGVNTIDPETVDDIEAGKEAGRITPAGGVIADQDYLLLEVHAEGLTGLLHEAVLENDTAGVEDLFDREDDVITVLWGLQLDEFTWRAAAVEPTDTDQDRLTIDLGQDVVIGGTGEDGVNYDAFYFPVRMEAGKAVTDGPRDLETPQDLDATFDIRRTEGSETVDDGFAEAQPDVEGFSFEAPFATVDKERVLFDAVNERFEVPLRENYTLPGVTNVAAGTNLTVQVNSKSGEDSAFFVLGSGIFPRQVEDRDQQVWSLPLGETLANVDDGTEFQIKIRRQGAAGTINSGDAIDGIVLEDPEVGSPYFVIQNISTNSPVTEGESLYVTATVENAGDVADTQNVSLTVGGSQRDVREVTLEPGDGVGVELSWQTGDGDAGNYSATVASENDSDSTSVHVNDPPSVSIDFVPMSPIVGETVELSANASDSDGIIVSYEWRIDGEIVSTNQSLNHTFESSGDKEVAITVKDNDFAVATASTNITVQTPEEGVVSVKKDVKELDLSTGMENSLLSKLEAAKKSLERDEEQPAINQLRAFINHVEAQKGKKIEEPDAESLTTHTRRIISSIDDEPRGVNKKKKKKKR